MVTKKPKIGFKKTKILFLILFGMTSKNMVKPTAKFNIKAERIPNTASITCAEQSTVTMVVYRLKMSGGVPMSFKLTSTAPYNGKLFNKNDINHFHHGMFELGNTNCVVHSNRANRNIYPIFILFAEKVSTTSNNCKVSYIVTNQGQGFESCPATTSVKDDIIRPSLDNSPPYSFDNFNSLNLASIHKSQYCRGMKYTIQNFDVLNDVTETLVELAVLEGMLVSVAPKPIFFYSYEVVNMINSRLSQNVHTRSITPKDTYEKLVVDNLPGYHIGAHSNFRLQSLMMPDPLMQDSALSLTVQFYIAKPNLVVAGETHTVHLSVRGYKSSPAETQENLDEQYYKVVFERVGSDIDVKVYQRDNLNNQITITSPPTSTDFVYMSLTCGEGVLFFKKGHEVGTKRYQTISAYWFDNQGQAQKIINTQTYERGRRTNHVFATGSSETKARWMRVQYWTSTSSQVNQVGLRIYGLYASDGVFPPHLISSTTNDPEFPRCYFHGFEKGNCFASAWLKNKDEESLPFVQSPRYQLKPLSSMPEEAKNCRVVYDDMKCVIAKDGFVTNLVVEMRTPLLYKSLKIADYNSLPPTTRNQFFLYDYASNNKYLMPCAHSCKFGDFLE